MYVFIFSWSDRTSCGLSWLMQKIDANPFKTFWRRKVLSIKVSLSVKESLNSTTPFPLFDMCRRFFCTIKVSLQLTQKGPKPKKIKRGKHVLLYMSVKKCNIFQSKQYILTHIISTVLLLLKPLKVYMVRCFSHAPFLSRRTCCRRFYSSHSTGLR